MPVTTPPDPDVVLVDAGQLLYHVVWPVTGTAGDLVASISAQLVHYPPGTKKIVLFDRYDQESLSAKDHEWARRGRAMEIRLTPNTPFHAEKLFFTMPRTRACLITSYVAIPFHTTSNSYNKLDCVVTHVEADITLCSYMLKAVAGGAQTIRIVSDDWISWYTGY